MALRIIQGDSGEKVSILRGDRKLWSFGAAGFRWCSFCRLKHNTQRTENKTTDVVIHQHSRKLMMMDILMSETC
jgi:hypothetical protein